MVAHARPGNVDIKAVLCFATLHAIVNNHGHALPIGNAADPVMRSWGALRLVASQEGLEPPTPNLEGSCSILMSYWLS